jgi:hypothetical protein
LDLVRGESLRLSIGDACSRGWEEEAPARVVAAAYAGRSARDAQHLSRSAAVGVARYCADGVEENVEVVRRSAEALIAHGLDGGRRPAAISDAAGRLLGGRLGEDARHP